MNFSNIQSALDDSDRRLLARADELRSRAAGGVPAFSGFLSPREVYILTAFGFETKCRRSELAMQDSIGFFWGGYSDAERKIYISLPGFAAYSLPEHSDDANAEDESFSPDELSRLASDELPAHISRLLIKKSGYVTLSHRDYMGALLGLGIERDHIGDIMLVDEGAVVFAEPGIANFLKNSLSEVGRDHVKVFDAPELELVRSFENVTGTVASARLDSVVSELSNCSRETAKELIRRGLVEHDYFPAADADAEVISGDVISIRRDGRVRGGKFVIDSIGTLTSKGRVRFLARRYI